MISEEQSIIELYNEANSEEIESYINLYISSVIGAYLPYVRKPESFKFDSGIFQFSERLKNRIYDFIEKKSKNAVTLSYLKNKQKFPDIEKPVIKGWLDRTIAKHTLKFRISKYVKTIEKELESQIGFLAKKGLSVSKAIIEARNAINGIGNLINKNPGKGTYVSPISNLTRLSSSEIIESYRRSDFLIWKSLNEVVGIRIHLNPMHPKPDSCDDLVGIYPKGFYFPGFHPKCICIAEPITKGEYIEEIGVSQREYMANKDKYKQLPFFSENMDFWNV